MSLFPICTSNRAFLPVLWRDPEFERGVISERTRAGLKAARARGRKGGRPRKMTASRIRMALAAMADPKAGPKSIARELGVTTTTLYAYVNGDSSPKAAAEAVLHRSARS